MNRRFLEPLDFLLVSDEASILTFRRVLVHTNISSVQGVEADTYQRRPIRELFPHDSLPGPLVPLRVLPP